jgi:flagellar basal body-associated protein FliL
MPRKEKSRKRVLLIVFAILLVVIFMIPVIGLIFH